MSKELVINNISQFSFLNWTEQVEFRERGCFFITAQKASLFIYLRLSVFTAFLSVCCWSKRSSWLCFDCFWNDS